MNYSVEVTEQFEKEIKKLIKKFPSLKQEFATLVAALSQDPFQGIGIGNDCYKVRLAIQSKGKGKSGGARVITNVYVAGQTVYLLTIYDKSERENIADKYLQQLLNAIR